MPPTLTIPDKLISLIERFDLTRFDNKKRKASKEEIHISIKNLIHTVKKETLYTLFQNTTRLPWRN